MADPRPVERDLKNLVVLLKPSLKRTSTGSVSFEKLDYHGITLLAAESSGMINQDNATANLLKQRRALAIANETLLKKALSDTFTQLCKLGLDRFIVFKGTALAYSIYPKPWLRPRSDCDILIDRRDLIRFKQAFEDLGFYCHFGISGHYVSYQQTFSRSLAGQSHLNIDLHWRISNRQCLANTYELDELLNQSRVLASICDSVRTPSTIDNILIACLHRLGHHPDEERLTWLYDIHLLCATLNPKDWAKLVSRAQNKNICSITLDALQLCVKVFETSIPESTLNTLSGPDNLTEQSAFLLQRDHPQWQYFKHDIKSINGLKGKLGFIKETLFPSRDYLRHQMGTTSMLKAHLKRLKNGVKRFSRSPSSQDK